MSWLLQVNTYLLMFLANALCLSLSVFRFRCEREKEARQASQDSGIKTKLEPMEAKPVPARTAHCEVYY